MRFLSFFAGIGGFDLGLERAGHECVGQIEIDPYARRVLERHWPDVRRFGDVRKLDAGELPDAELWCGGFPCQPFSSAGKRAGTCDKRNLWPAWCRLIAERRPRWVFGENVPGLLSANGGGAFGAILGDLASLGYVCEWTIIGARDVGAPHRRERLWLVANLPDTHADGVWLKPKWCASPRRDNSVGERAEAEAGSRAPEPLDDGAHGHVAHADGGRLSVERLAQHGGELGAPRCEPHGRGEGRRWDRQDVANAESVAERTGLRADGPRGERGRRSSDERRARCWCGRGEPWCCDPADNPTQPRLGRVASRVPRRVDRLACIGNSVVPLVVELIARKVWG